MLAINLIMLCLKLTMLSAAQVSKRLLGGF